MLKKLALASLLTASLIAPLAASAGEVRNRIANEQGRINQGLRSGDLRHGQAAQLEGRLNQIRTQRRSDLAANGGKLTQGEYHQLNREENHLSDRIYDDKHGDSPQQ